MKTLVTGADGFIGSHLAERLVVQGSQVVALCQYNSFGHRGWLDSSPLVTEMDTRLGDVRDLEFCHSLMREVDVVYHLAALIGIPYSYLAPESYVATNVTGTSNILQSSLRAGVARVVVTSTSEVYGTACYTPIDEKHPLQPQSPYSASKIGADALALSFHASFDLPVTIARPFNTYGPRQSSRAIIPTIICQILGGRESLQLGDLEPKRDLTYVSDTCEGMIAAGSNQTLIGETVNIGSGSSHSVRELVQKIQEMIGSEISIREDSQRVRPRSSEVFLLEADVAKIREKTTFETKISLEDGLTRTIDWFRENPNYWRTGSEYSI